MTRLLIALALLASCATVRPTLCEVGGTALVDAAPESGAGKVATGVGRLLWEVFCRKKAPTGATDLLREVSRR